MSGRRAPDSRSGISRLGSSYGQRGNGITGDLARWGSCGIPSAWRSPTTRRPMGSPRRNRCVPHVALPLDCRVVALGEAGGMLQPAQAQPQRFLCPAIPEDCPPRRGQVWSGRAAFADAAPLGQRQPGFDGQDGQWPAEMSGDIGRRWPVLGGATVARFVPGFAQTYRTRPPARNHHNRKTDR
jgi:hypothetical protein